ncbi:cytochrome C oxidase subunit III [Sphingobacteriaceae bacterium]|nr:cytochrome C oxidase subunit III [Sphingobacteriaceae bacterium]
MKTTSLNSMKKNYFLMGICLLPIVSLAQEQEVQNTTTYFSNALFNTLLVVIIILAIMVMALSSALKNIIGSDMFLEKIKRDKEQKNNGSLKIMGWLFFFLSLNFAAFSQSKAAQVIDDRIGGLDQFTFYTMVIVIALELVVLAVMFNTFRSILGAKKPKLVNAAEAKPKTKTLLDKINDTVDIEEEQSIMLDHDYDGIKELDNNLPPWWKYGFYLTILIAVIYLINFHVIKTSPLQADEYKNSIKKAEAEIAEYMKNSANNVDESTVKTLTDLSDLTAGKDIFISTCSACHGKLGEGTVGPNLTDEYWIHGGSLKDIFKTIKYGWPDKGMKSWKEDFSPIQIAQLTSYIRTLKGTNPAKPKDKQGELYIEKSMPSDSSSVMADSTKTIASELKN